MVPWSLYGPAESIINATLCTGGQSTDLLRMLICKSTQRSEVRYSTQQFERLVTTSISEVSSRGNGSVIFHYYCVLFSSRMDGAFSVLFRVGTAFSVLFHVDSAFSVLVVFVIPIVCFYSIVSSHP